VKRPALRKDGQPFCIAFNRDATPACGPATICALPVVRQGVSIMNEKAKPHTNPLTKRRRTMKDHVSYSTQRVVSTVDYGRLRLFVGTVRSTNAQERPASSKLAISL